MANQLVTYRWRHVTPKGRGPNTVRVQYRENSWRCYLATIARPNFLLFRRRRVADNRSRMYSKGNIPNFWPKWPTFYWLRASQRFDGKLRPNGQIYYSYFYLYFNLVQLSFCVINEHACMYVYTAMATMDYEIIHILQHTRQIVFCESPTTSFLQDPRETQPISG